MASAQFDWTVPFFLPLARLALALVADVLRHLLQGLLQDIPIAHFALQSGSCQLNGQGLKEGHVPIKGRADHGALVLVVDLAHVPQTHLWGELLLHCCLDLCPLLFFRDAFEHGHNSTVVRMEGILLLMSRPGFQLGQRRISRSAKRCVVLVDLNLGLLESCHHVVLGGTHGLHLVALEDQRQIQPSIFVFSDLFVKELVVLQVLITQVIFHLLPHHCTVGWGGLEALGLLGLFARARLVLSLFALGFFLLLSVCHRRTF
mmetsp:Transcript_73605/g.117064  ORF Transcript_73605/g.117064 Transcript_73605/m.117064 type:complete len:260 (-) Transcript_73605:52-831(-)